MAYTINKTDGSLYATVANGTINSTTSLTLVGKNYTGYGEIQNENYFRLLESHANLTPPSNPQTGQLWFDTTNSALNVYTDGTMAPKSLAVQATSLTEPAAIDSQVGDTWYNTTTKQLTVYDGSTYTTVGPLYSSTEGETGAIVTTITDTLAADHVVTQLMNNNEITAIVSKDASFTPSPAILGFATIEPGVTMSTNVPGAQFVGDASNALLLNGSPSTDFLLSNADNTTTGKLDIVNDTGLTIGVSNDLRLGITGGIHAEIINDTVNGDIYIRTSGAGTGTGITIDGASGNARVELPNNGLDIVNQSYVTSLASNKLDIDGSTNMTGSLVMDPNTSINAGYSGTFSTLSYTFDNDPNTGILGGSGDYMYLVTGGLPRLTINNVGKLTVGAANYETLVLADDDIPNKKYVDDAIAGQMIGIDNPVNTGVTFNSTSGGAWQTITVNANAKFAMVQCDAWAIFGANSGNSRLEVFARKKGVTGVADRKWRINWVGADDGATGATNLGNSFTIVECNASGQFEFYGWKKGTTTSPDAEIRVRGYWI